MVRKNNVGYTKPRGGLAHYSCEDSSISHIFERINLLILNEIFVKNINKFSLILLWEIILGKIKGINKLFTSSF